MKTIALRYAENFAPEIGTIAAHETIIAKCGYVWYGKLGTGVSDKNIKMILSSEKQPMILLVHSGGIERYWALVADISKSVPPLKEIPEYYRHSVTRFKCWFKRLFINKCGYINQRMC